LIDRWRPGCYSPHEFTIARGHIRHGASDTQIDGDRLALDGLEFFCRNKPWSRRWQAFDATPGRNLQQLWHSVYRCGENLSGQFPGGTGAETFGDGRFDLRWRCTRVFTGCAALPLHRTGFPLAEQSCGFPIGKRIGRGAVIVEGTAERNIDSRSEFRPPIWWALPSAG